MKKLELYKVAPVMVFNFNRFKSHNVTFSEKINDKISFPVHGLDMTPYVLQNPSAKDPKANKKTKLIYDLHGIIEHYGDLNHGHYIAYAKNSLTQQWYQYNDSVVTQLDDP